ncbi:MAG: NUDIX hydrolase [Mucilaginibacter polytrichastri]|nr:NUDIX hydrolase [Mucilaginibacter polytrichastri]
MRDLRWEILSSRYIHKSNWATLRVDQCRLPDGRIMDDYYVLEYPNWVNGVAITEEGKVLIVHQYRNAAQITAVEIPGGVIDGDEAPEDAIKRELLEETGYAFEHAELIGSQYPNPATSTNITFFYLLKNGKKVQAQQFDEHEDLVVEEVSIEQFKEMVLANKLSQALHQSAAFLALVRLGLLK